ncbi:HAMP domain-containing histidine kinase [Kribbella qitaiheensis]|uniref:histidine kinase n=1 Tax=Kribbella qitaiheensis TaxID=1544730 RepID=A0A7G6WSN2_9ACTN|nr:HAMP domain-containing sensor histidine kinase [Kribbella qitaiheensis]QNE16997.1 HAMP domain-containing histidine kinase [Kribbella qitaiheensis]
MTVRVRVTLAAVLVVGLALVAGALVLVALLSSALTDQVCANARERAAQLASSLPGTRVSTPGELVQLVDASGKVIDAAPDVRRYADPGARCVKAEPAGYNEDFLFAAAIAQQPGGAQVIVGRPLVDVLDSTRFVTRVLLVGMPLILLVVGGVAWTVTGRTLAPVTAIRREVDEISAAELHRRVPTVHDRDEIGRLAATMNRMLDRLEQAQDSQRRFVSDASHELRSPIASIRQHVEVALTHPDRSSLQELAGTVQAENLRMQRLVDDLLLLARADEQDLHLPKLPVDLDDLVFDQAHRLRTATNFEIDTSAVSAGRVLGDDTSLRRMLHNLTENASRYADKRIALTLGESNGEVVLTVADDGPGIPSADRERIFERFVRLATARGREDGGSGLGLAIVAEIVKAHGGRVEVAGNGAAALDGAVIEIRLPASDA